MDKYNTLEYSWLKATTVSMRLWIYLYAFKIYQQAFWCYCRGNNWRKDFDTSLMSANLVVTSFCGITPILLNCAKDRTTYTVLTFWQVSTRKEEILENPGCLSFMIHQQWNPAISHVLYRYIYIFLTMCKLEKRSPS